MNVIYDLLDQTSTIEISPKLSKIAEINLQLESYFKDKFVIQPALNRQLVSFQANKERPIYRWYKYKEAFSAALVEFLFDQYSLKRGKILDPFAGSGTALFAANNRGMDADGIELLPIGQKIIHAQQLLRADLPLSLNKKLSDWVQKCCWKAATDFVKLPEFRITHGAYPQDTKENIEKFLAAIDAVGNDERSILKFALLCVLESVSYTRKDGQYLRWDYRSGRKQGDKPFNKGHIVPFEMAIIDKVKEILSDLTDSAPTQIGMFERNLEKGKNIRLFDGSCLDILPTIDDNTYDAIITSPPYCNRYDYTRTYALELALLGVDEKGLVKLRQDMLSCTVENRAKDLIYMNPSWKDAIFYADQHQLLQSILNYLESLRLVGQLNNTGIPRMIRGYFYEMACVIQECFRVLKKDGLIFMVNDNVRYAGASISVDLILSSFAEKLGFRVEQILVLPNGKGNSSQQMGVHGREKLRKCVYVWRKI